RRVRPVAASKNESVVVPRSGGWTKPNVNIDEPLISNDRSKSCTPNAWYIAPKAKSRRISQASGNRKRQIGAYKAITRSRASQLRVRRARRVKTVRRAKNTAREAKAASPRGSRKVRTAESSTKNRSANPATNQRILTTMSKARQLRRPPPWLARYDRNT